MAIDTDRIQEILSAAHAEGRTSLYEHECYRLLEATGKRHGQILIEEGMLAPGDLYQAIRGQVESIVWSVFAWQTGEVTEGRYAAGFSFFQKLAISVGLVITGYILKYIGYVSGAEVQAPEVIHRLAVATFIAGPIMMVFSFAVLRTYPITHESMTALRKKYGQAAD